MIRGTAVAKHLIFDNRLLSFHLADDIPKMRRIVRMRSVKFNFISAFDVEMVLGAIHLDY